MKRASVATYLSLAIVLAAAASCATSPAGTSSGPSMSMSAPTPDPRVGLRGGRFDAAEAAWNMRLVSATPPTPQFIDRANPGNSQLWNSDLAFLDHYVIQGNFSGYQIWDVANPSRPTLYSSYLCPGTQSDVSIHRGLLFESSESLNARNDCGSQGVTDTVSTERLRGIRIYDVSDLAHPKLRGVVQTCRGSHTHTVLTDPRDSDNVYIYISGSAPVRSPNELAGCSAMDPAQDPHSEIFRIEVIKVPVAHPDQAQVVSKPAILADLAPVTSHGEMPADSAARIAAMRAQGINPDTVRRQPRPARGPQQCHDITVYPAIGRAGGACGGYGVLLDISNPAEPRRIGAVADPNFSFWHSATFNNDGSKILFTDEWGGGTQPRCRATDKPEWGANAIFTLEGSTMTFKSYYKLPAPQTPQENCVAHNGTLVPIPGRDVMVQGWYQGGISVFDFTDASHPREIAFFDRGPLDPSKMYVAGSWSAYWHNGYIYSSEIGRGLDILELTPSAMLTQNEIDAAKSVRLNEWNPQDQQQIVFPPSFAVARSYVDQLVRGNGLARDRTAALYGDLTRAEKMTGSERSAALTQLATRLDSDAQGASDGAKVRMLAAAVRELAGGR